MIKRFNFLTEDEERIRTEVFVEEQGFKEEFDSIDDNCIHLVKYIDNKAVGVCRLYPDKDQIYYIGRVAVDKNFRGKSICLRLKKSLRLRVEEFLPFLLRSESNLFTKVLATNLLGKYIWMNIALTFIWKSTFHKFKT